MEMKKGKLAALIALAALTLLSVGISPAQAVPSSPVQSITPIQGFPASIVAGSTYTVRYRFNNTANEIVTVFVNMNVSNKKYPVNFGEFFVSMWLNSSRLNCSEKRPGSFYCYNKTSEFSVAKKSANELYINFSSLPNLYPDSNYTFTLGILTEHPLINVLFADGSGDLRVSGKAIFGQAKIYMDSGKNFVKFWIRDGRTKKEYTRDYEVRSHYRTWYGEIYSCRNEAGQTFSITVLFGRWVYASGTDASFWGTLA